MFGVSHFLVVVQVTCWVSWPALRMKSPSSSTHLPSSPTKARSLAGSTNVTVADWPGARETLSKARRTRLSGTSEATRSLEYSSTASLPATEPVFFTSTLTFRSSAAVKEALSTLRFEYSKVV